MTHPARRPTSSTEPEPETDPSGLDSVYDLDGPEATRAFYADWAARYDAELTAAGYASPARCAKALAALVPDREAPILDIGCGTGLSGQALAAEGFATVDGVDFSPEMLAVARSKNVYRTLFEGDAANPLPGAPGDYAHATAVGVFSPGHAPATLIQSALAHLPRGGVLVFTLNDHAARDPSYQAQLREVTDTGWAHLLLREHGPHMPDRELGALVCALRRA